MKKLLLLLIAFFLIGCSPTSVTYDIDTSQLSEELYIDSFVLSDILILVNNPNGLTESVPVAPSMLYQTDLDKLQTPGTHTITIMYRGVEHVVIITLLDALGPNFVRDLLVEVINIGQADAIFIQLPNGENLMIDVGIGASGSWNVINNTLQKYEVTTIDHLIITHNHEDHYGNVPNLLSNYQVDNIYGSGSTRTNPQYLAVMKAIEDSGNVLYVVQTGDMIIDEIGLTLQVVATQQIANETNPNISSVMVKLTYLDNAFMFTGDAGVASSSDGENTALASGIDLTSDVLKVGHHGSDNSSSTAFLEAVQPVLAVMTTVQGSNTLPHPGALSRIAAIGAILYDTKVHGNVIFVSDGETITVITSNELG